MLLSVRYILAARHTAPYLGRTRYLVQPSDKPSDKPIRPSSYLEALGDLHPCPRDSDDSDRVAIGKYEFLVTMLRGQECVRLDHLALNHRHQLWRIGSFDDHLGNPNIWVPIEEARRAVKLLQPSGYLLQ